MSDTAPLSPNAEAIRAWDGPLFERFTRFREVVTTGLGSHGNEALRLFPPQPGDAVIDLGCGFGDTTQQIAALVGPAGEAFGVDARPGSSRRRPRRRARRASTTSATPSPTCRPRPRAAVRHGVLAHGHDVLRVARRRPAQRAQRAEAGRAARDGRVAQPDRQRVAVPGAGDRRRDRKAPRGVRGADLRTRAVLDGRRGHGLRHPAHAGFDESCCAAATCRSSSAATWTRRSTW